MARRKRHLCCVIAAYLATGAVVVQLGPLCSVAGGTALGTSIGNFIDANGRFLGIFNVCGVPDIVFTDASGLPISSTTGTGIVVVNAEDDLFVGCPVELRQATTGTGG